MQKEMMKGRDALPAPEPTWLDGELVLWVSCPGCGLRALVDDDQAHGRVSTDCPNCAFHETQDWWLKLSSGLEDSLRILRGEVQS